MANNQHVNKVEYGGNTLIDLTGDTVTASDMLSGVTAHDRSGAQISGTLVPVTGVKGDAESSYRTGNVNLTPGNIGAAPYVHLNISSPTATAVYNKLNAALPSSLNSAVIYINGDTASLLTGGKVTVAVQGTVARYTSNSFRFFTAKLNGSNIYTWAASYASGTWTISTVYSYTGTAI